MSSQPAGAEDPASAVGPTWWTPSGEQPTPAPATWPGLLVDRDGTLTVERSHLADPGDLLPIEGAQAAMSRAAEAGLRIGVVTNQSAIARGVVDEAGMRRLHDRLHELFPRIEIILHCPHHPDAGCPCRKPKPQMLTTAMTVLGVDPGHCAYVGDHAKDVLAARAAGIDGYLVLTGHGRHHVAAATYLKSPIVADLAAAVDRHLATLDG